MITSLIPIFLYMLAAWQQQQQFVLVTIKRGLLPLQLAALGWVCHSFSLYNRLFSQSGLVLDLVAALSLIGWLIIAMIILSNLRKQLSNLLIVVLPATSLALTAGLLIPVTVIGKYYSIGMLVHILVSVIAYSLLAIAACQAVLLNVQINQLKRRSVVGAMIRNLPPLQTMEQLLFQMLFPGLLCLTASLASGLIFLEDILAQHVAHKTWLSILAWITFALLIFGRYWLGWRGRRAISINLIGFSFLVLAWFGSKLVIEYLL